MSSSHIGAGGGRGGGGGNGRGGNDGGGNGNGNGNGGFGGGGGPNVFKDSNNATAAASDEDATTHCPTTTDTTTTTTTSTSTSSSSSSSKGSSSSSAGRSGVDNSDVPSVRSGRGNRAGPTTPAAAASNTGSSSSSTSSSRARNSVDSGTGNDDDNDDDESDQGGGDGNRPDANTPAAAPTAARFRGLPWFGSSNASLYFGVASAAAAAARAAAASSSSLAASFSALSISSHLPTSSTTAAAAARDRSWLPSPFSPNSRDLPSDQLAASARRLHALIADANTRRPPPVDPLSLQPPELTIRILSFLSAHDLAKAALLNTHIMHLANQDALWKTLCAHRWADKKFQVLSYHPRVDYTAQSDQLSDLDIRKILERRFVGLPRQHDSAVDLFESQDGGAGGDDAGGQAAAWRAPREEEEGMRGVLDRAALVEKLKATTPPLSIKPVLSCKWKASYAAAEKDKHRERILPEELMAYEWIFSDGWSYGYGNDAETQILVKFRKDGTRSNVNPLMPRPRPQPWEIQRDGSIRVANFPLHSRPKRTPDWGWTFTNGYVEYTAK